MNLIIDSGNTQTKVGVFDKGNLVSAFSVKIFDQSTVEKVCRQHSIRRALVGSVNTDPHLIVHWLRSKGMEPVVAQSTMPLPFELHYQTPHSLGVDRVAAVAGASVLFPDQNLLVMDAGTALTYEFFTDEGVYLGGNIAPGMQMRFQALHHYTRKLPLVDAQNLNQLVGNSTTEAIASGVISGMVFEMEGYRTYMAQQFDHFQTILTGGDAVFFAEKLKNPIFVNPNLVLIGLNRLLDYNA